MGGAKEGGTPPTVDRHGHRIRANPRRFFFGGGGQGWEYSQLSPDLLAGGKGPAALLLPKKPTPVSAHGPRHRWAPNFEILATPLQVT